MTCPRCGVDALDLRNTGFNPAALEAEGTCYRWAADAYSCNNPPPGPNRPPPATFSNCWGGPREAVAGNQPRPVVLDEAAKAEVARLRAEHEAALDNPLVRVAGYTVQTAQGPLLVPGGDIPASQVDAYLARRAMLQEPAPSPTCACHPGETGLVVTDEDGLTYCRLSGHRVYPAAP